LACVCKPPLTGAQSTHDAGLLRIHCKRSSMRRPISSFSQGDAACGQAAQRAQATGSKVGGRSAREVVDMGPIIDTTPYTFIARHFNPCSRVFSPMLACCAGPVFVISADAGPASLCAHLVSSALPNRYCAAPLAPSHSARQLTTHTPRGLSFALTAPNTPARLTPAWQQ